jgi:hypothetical protein
VSKRIKSNRNVGRAKQAIETPAMFDMEKNITPSPVPSKKYHDTKTLRKIVLKLNRGKDE